MPRAKQRTPELRERLLAGALRVLERDGVAGFTTRKLAREAGTSTPAVYELFGAKGGVVRAVFFEGFRRLRRELDAGPQTDDPRADLVALVDVYRRFVRDHPVLSEVMFSRPFTDFEPGPDEIQTSGSVREFIVGRVRRCIDAGILSGEETDMAHALVSLTQGLAAAEKARRLGTSRESIDRRWALAVNAMLDGLSGRAQPPARVDLVDQRP